VEGWVGSTAVYPILQLERGAARWLESVPKLTCAVLRPHPGSTQVPSHSPGTIIRGTKDAANERRRIHENADVGAAAFCCDRGCYNSAIKRRLPVMKTPETGRSVLVLGSERKRALSQVLSEIELAPTFATSLEGILHALRHTQAVAILVDRDQRIADELELVLNVRDLNRDIPILLIGSPREDRADEVLLRQPGTFLIHKPANSSSLAASLKAFTKEARFSSA
jgi:hypothetical protein